MRTRDIIDKRRAAHHATLGTLIGGDAAAGLKLWRRLLRIERRLDPIREHYSNGTGGIGQDQWYAAKEKARAEIIKLFGGTLPDGLYINGDPRGHVLKLDSDKCTVPEGMERDWGGNGILAIIIDE